jgi:hypothetical protein
VLCFSSLLPPLFSTLLQFFASVVCSFPFSALSFSALIQAFAPSPSALCFSILLQQFVPAPFQRFALAFCFSNLFLPLFSALL